MNSDTTVVSNFRMNSIFTINSLAMNTCTMNGDFGMKGREPMNSDVISR